MVAQPSEFASARASGEEPPLDERATFLQALRETMLATLTTERLRIADDIERRRAAHIAAVDARRESMANRMRELAEKDREAIAGWAVDEQIQVERERQRRIQDVERDLEASLAEHDARIEQEIQNAEAAIAAHRVELEAFFEALSRETDPVVIAQQAGAYPRFPSIETNVHAIVSTPPRVSDAPVVAAAVDVPAPAAPAVVAEAAADAPEAPAAADVAAAQEPVPAGDTAKPEAQPVPVMDPIAAKRAEWWAAWKELHEPPELSEVLATVEQEAETSDVLEAVTAGPGPGPAAPSSGVLLSSIPILRPFNWLRRDRDAVEGTTGEK